MDDQTGQPEDNDQEQPEKPRKLTGKDDITTIKHTAAAILAENGMGYGAIGKAIERSNSTIKQVVPRMRRESLSSPRKVKLASKFSEKVLEECLKPADQADPRVKMSDGARVFEAIYARVEPVKPDPAAGGGVSQTFIQVNQQFINEMPDKDRAKIEG